MAATGLQALAQYFDSDEEEYVQLHKTRRLSALQKNEVSHDSGSSGHLHSSDKEALADSPIHNGEATFPQLAAAIENPSFEGFIDTIEECIQKPFLDLLMTPKAKLDPAFKKRLNEAAVEGGNFKVIDSYHCPVGEEYKKIVFGTALNTTDPCALKYVVGIRMSNALDIFDPYEFPGEWEVVTCTLKGDAYTISIQEYIEMQEKKGEVWAKSAADLHTLSAHMTRLVCAGKCDMESEDDSEHGSEHDSKHDSEHDSEHDSADLNKNLVAAPKCDQRSEENSKSESVVEQGNARKRRKLCGANHAKTRKSSRQPTKEEGEPVKNASNADNRNQGFSTGTTKMKMQEPVYSTPSNAKKPIRLSLLYYNSSVIQATYVSAISVKFRVFLT